MIWMIKLRGACDEEWYNWYRREIGRVMADGLTVMNALYRERIRAQAGAPADDDEK